MANEIYDKVDEYLRRFKIDCKNNNLSSLEEYFYDKDFLIAFCNNSETSYYNFIYLTAIKMDKDKKEKIFRLIYDNIQDTKKERISGGKNFNEFYHPIKNMEYKFPEIIDKTQEELDMEDAKFLLNSAFVENANN